VFDDPPANEGFEFEGAEVFPPPKRPPPALLPPKLPPPPVPDGVVLVVFPPPNNPNVPPEGVGFAKIQWCQTIGIDFQN